MMFHKNVLGGKVLDKNDILIDMLKFLILMLMLLSISALAYSSVFALPNAVLFLYFLLIPATLSFLLARIPLKLWTMLLCQSVLALCPLLIMFFRPDYESVVPVLLMCVIVMVSLNKRYTPRKKSTVSYETLGASATIHAFLLILCTFFPSGNLPYFLLAHSLISICLFFAAHQKFAFETGYGHIVNSPTQPVDSVKRQNNLVISLMFVFLLVVIPLTVFFPYAILLKILATVLKWMLIIIAAIYTLLKKLHILPGISEEVPNSEPSKEAVVANNKLLEYLWVALMFIASVAFLIFIAYGIYRIIRFIITRYRHALPGLNTSSVDLIRDEIISLEKMRVKRYRRNDFGKGKEKEVRKLYFRSVKKEIRSGAVITAPQSPGEIIQAIKKSSGNDLTKLTNRYELFRYGHGNDDVNSRNN